MPRSRRAVPLHPQGRSLRAGPWRPSGLAGSARGCLPGVRRAGAVPRGAWLLFLPGEFSAWPPSLLEAPPPWSAASSSRYLILGLCKREGGAWPCPALGSHPEGRARRPHLERSLKAGRAATAQPVPAPCPRPAASSSWRGSWLCGQSCRQHPPRMTPVSMSAWPSTARHGTPGERPASLPFSPRAAGVGAAASTGPCPARWGSAASLDPALGPGQHLPERDAALALPGAGRPRLPTAPPLPCSQSRRVPQPGDGCGELHGGVPVRWRLREHPQVLPGSLRQGLPEA